MKKLLTVISIVCLGAFGFAGSVFAGGPDFLCGESGPACGPSDDLYEVSLKCDKGDTFGVFSGGLDVDSGGWDLDVDYDPDSRDGDDFETVCDMDGELDLLKTEVKCTEQSRGSNKSGKNKPSGALQVEAEMKLDEVDGCA